MKRSHANQDAAASGQATHGSIAVSSLNIAYRRDRGERRVLLTKKLRPNSSECCFDSVYQLPVLRRLC